ncbi:immediate early response gene 5-like protein [Lingula anatina]|uniref:Immediate early response gene 5-like protein n=1 Tax=Lingula anatina TaxID=7574 RepID=A0A1S3K067_LINAN|nr:immediate early response gene 5-like protein [Lingula anatina]|eukprot:XP_013415754.1 immediate early response gene 5-like protein [Lingula anatina]
MGTEAHRLITVSLGKIAQCRQQRGGVNLHKSLLVTKVLYKARTAYMMQNFREVVDSKTRTAKTHSSSEKQVSKSKSAETTLQVQIHPTPAGNAAPCDSESAGCISPSETHEDKENIPPAQEMSAETKDSFENSDENMISKESSLDNKSDVDNNADSECAKCVKRRLSETELAVDSISPVKRSKFCDAETQVDTEPMQTETTQISNLVNIFSSGFTGLISNSHNNNSSVENSIQTAEKTRLGSDTQSTISQCGKHIKEAFETLARPVIALTV